mmetsp:Transcript_768/g.2150  ORF Transcript_768/g.2150 Transcript_768/m.2150 type:complete len:224 (+) Transcript_768:143-814(+)|eukprot:CAMPEP_0177189582 /NCGR_PEP_ID=MMETSP0367-20130122/20345_1 /TAXON_ID=447022 ORGANISM="Scrippsiella hangoei-like, Strain SHHI-4" /NCGR_SAMPLE_ID=MMETSP0367 /ASSEMBLY_ACC=CAM_ASM_000362 /LENGTH=223 /DNA_ID=CAMNT_0018637129 /DNA_START=74 /DNA_END=745 /DNA_ORIENTATION=+
MCVANQGRKQKRTTLLASLRTLLFCCTAVAAVRLMDTCWAVQRETAAEPTPTQNQKLAPHVVEVSGTGFCLTFDPHGGPAGKGRVVVEPRWSNAPSSEDIRHFLDAVIAFSREYERDLSKGFVAILDSTHLVWPSMLSVPQIVSVVRELPPPASLRAGTKAIAIVYRESRWAETMVPYLWDVVAAVTKPVLVPIFATSQKAADDRFLSDLSASRRISVMAGGA